MAFDPMNPTRRKRPDEEDDGTGAPATKKTPGIGDIQIPGGGGAGTAVQSPHSNATIDPGHPLNTTPGSNAGAAVQAGQQLDDQQGGGARDDTNAANMQADDRDTMSSGDDMNSVIEEWVRSHLTQNTDTSAREQAIRDEQQAQLGMGLFDQRARMGRAGIVGGTTAGLEADARANAARSTMDQIFGVQDAAQQRDYEQGLGAAGLDINEREQASKDAYRKAAADAMNAILGDGANGSAPDADPGNSTDRTIGAIENGVDPVEAAFGTHVSGAAPRDLSDEQKQKAEPVSTPPDGAQLVYSDGSGNYYVDPDNEGKVYVVKIATAHDYG